MNAAGDLSIFLNIMKSVGTAKVEDHEHDLVSVCAQHGWSVTFIDIVCHYQASLD